MPLTPQPGIPDPSGFTNVCSRAARACGAVIPAETGLAFGPDNQLFSRASASKGCERGFAALARKLDDADPNCAGTAAHSQRDLVVHLTTNHQVDARPAQGE